MSKQFKSFLLFGLIGLIAVNAFPVEVEDLEKAEDKLDLSIVKNHGGPDIGFTNHGSVVAISHQHRRTLVYGEEGLISIGAFNNTAKNEALNITLHDVRELDDNYAVLRTINFTDAVFTFESLFSTEVDGMNATAMNFSLLILDDARIGVTVIVLDEDGGITVGDNVVNASASSVKVLLDILNWPFCDGDTENAGCDRNSTGSLLEVTWSINTKPTDLRRLTETAFELTSFDLAIIWPRDVVVDNNLGELPEGYPVISHPRGSATLFTVGLPAFENRGILDITLVPVQNIEEDLEVVEANNRQVRLLVDQGTGLITVNNSEAEVNVQIAWIQEKGITNEPVGVVGLGAIAQHNRTGVNSVYTVSEPTEEVEDGANVLAIVSSTEVLRESSMNVSSLLFTDTNTTRIGNRTVEVDTASVKMVLRLNNWPFCGDQGSELGACDGTEIGQYVEIGILIASGEQLLEREDDDNDLEYAFQDNADVVLSREVSIDGVLVRMQAGFPRVDNLNGRSYVVIRVPRFAESVEYDWLIKLHESDQELPPFNAPSPSPLVSAARDS